VRFEGGALGFELCVLARCIGISLWFPFSGFGCWVRGFGFRVLGGGFQISVFRLGGTIFWFILSC
jgi:hypothetical protein